jgi:dTMP kinase
MLDKESLKGYFIVVDGPNGVGKSTLIEAIKNKLELLGYDVYITNEPTNTELGSFLRKFAEEHTGLSLACLVAADRYEHIEKEILPSLKKGRLVISDRYVLSSLILQEMDGVSSEIVLNLNSQIIKPDLQLAVFADEKILQKRLSERNILTRFEKGNQSQRELNFMEEGITELKKHNIDIMNIYNNDNLEENVEKVVSYVVNNWRKA